jgi:hypothetical protein
MLPIRSAEEMIVSAWIVPEIVFKGLKEFSVSPSGLGAIFHIFAQHKFYSCQY